MSEDQSGAVLCRYEKLALRENRLRDTRRLSVSESPDQLARGDDLKRRHVDIPDRLSGSES